MIWFAIAFIAWLEVTEPASTLCSDPNVQALPEMCHATFNRSSANQVRLYSDGQTGRLYLK